MPGGTGLYKGCSGQARSGADLLHSGQGAALLMLVYGLFSLHSDCVSLWRSERVCLLTRLVWDEEGFGVQSMKYECINDFGCTEIKDFDKQGAPMHTECKLVFSKAQDLVC